MQLHALQHHNLLLTAAITAFLGTHCDGVDVPHNRVAFINANRQPALLAADTLEHEMRPESYNTDWSSYPAFLRQPVADLYGIFGQQLPAAFYRVFEVLPSVGQFQDYRQNNRYLTAHFRTLDAAIHATALETPVLMTVQAVLSGHGLQFVHLDGCCPCVQAYHGPAFPVPDLDSYGERLYSDYYALFLQEHIRFPQ